MFLSPAPPFLFSFVVWLFLYLFVVFTFVTLYTLIYLILEYTFLYLEKKHCLYVYFNLWSVRFYI